MAKSSKDDFMGLFWKLSNPCDDVRIEASEKIVTELMQCQKKYEDSQDSEDPWCSEVQYSLGRLLQGLASERKASRLGYSLALTHLMAKLDLNDDSQIGKVLSLADEKLNKSKEKKVEKGVLIGNVFAFLSVIQSCKLGSAKSSVKTIFDGLLKLSKMKSYLTPSSLHAICELIQKVPNSIFDEVMWPQLSDIFSYGWRECNADTFQILQACCKYQSDTCGKTFLKTHKFIGQKSKKIELFGLHSYKPLGQLLPATTICHPRVHPLCFEVVDHIVKSDNDTFKKFWKESIEENLHESTPERKYLGLKLSLHITSELTASQIPTVWSSKLITSMMYIFSNKSNPLHDVCKSEILEGLAEKMKSGTHEQQLTILFQFFMSPAGLFLDDNTNTRCIALLVSSLNLQALLKYIDWLKKVFATGKLNHDGVKEVTQETARRWSLLQLSQLIRNSRLPREDAWIWQILQFLLALHHFSWKGKAKTISGFKDIAEISNSMSEKTREHLRQCIEPALNAINSMPPPSQKDEKTTQRFYGTAHDGELWVCKMINYMNILMSKHKVSLISPLDAKSKEMWYELTERLSLMKNIQESDKSRETEAVALRLLLSHVGIRLTNCAKEELSSTQEVLNDLFDVVDSQFAEESVKGNKEDKEKWVEVIIETILSMLSQNSRSIRLVANQVFKLLATHLTREGLQLILNVLDPEKNAQVLQFEGDSDEEMEDGGSDDDDHEDSDSDDSAFDDADGSDEADEENNKFREKVKEALGDAAQSSDEEDDDEEGGASSQVISKGDGDTEDEDSAPELDDDAMMRIDSVLSEVFRQNNKLAKKKMKEDSHQQLLVFQLRCLDLIEIMASRRHNQESDEVTADSLIIDVVKPLFIAIQHASKSATDMTLAEKASVLLRVKICKMKKYPRKLDDEMIDRCHVAIEDIMISAYKAHSVFICQLASDCCMFLLRVLSGNKTGHSDDSTGAIDLERVLDVYKGAMENYMTKGGSHLQPCILEDFIARFPRIAANLAPDLLKYTKDSGITTYRRNKACGMLHSLLKNSAGREKCENVISEVVSVANELLQRVLEGGDMKAKFYAELLKLYHQVISLLQSSDKLKSLNLSNHVPVLHKFLETSNVIKSQELTNWTWKILHLLGTERNKVSNKLTGRKRTKENSESEIHNDSTEKDKNCDETVKESRKELKARVLKEKKERRKKKSLDSAPKKSPDKNSDQGNAKANKKRKKFKKSDKVTG